MSVAMTMLEEPVHSAPRAPQAVASPNPGPAEPINALTPDGRLRVENLPKTDMQLALAVHLSPLLCVLTWLTFWPALCAPLVIWLVRKDKSAFIDDHGREMCNVIISGMIVAVAGFIAGFLSFGLAWIATIAWFIAIIVSMIRAALASSRGEYFRYPMTIRFLS